MGAVCVGCALANEARVPVLPALVAAAVVGALALVLADPRRASAPRVPRWSPAAGRWGSMRLAELDHSVLVSRIGTVEQALVEVEEPPKAGRFDQRARGVVLRWGTLRPREPVYLELPLGRAPPQGADISLLGQLRAPTGPSNGFDQATWLRRQGIHVVLRAKAVAGRRPARRDLRARRRRRAVARGRQRPGPERRAARRHRGDRPRALDPRRSSRCSRTSAPRVCTTASRSTA